MTTYQAFHRRSIEQRDEFWGEQAQLVHWEKAPEQICDFSNPPFVKWFKGGLTNLCYNAVDRHVEAGRGDDRAGQDRRRDLRTERRTDRTDQGVEDLVPPQP